MPLTYSDLVNPKPVGVIKSSLLQQLSELGLPALSWETGSVPSALVEIQARALADLHVAQKYIAEGGLNETATGDALDLLSQQVYDNTRFAGTTTIGYVRLTDISGAGPFSFSATSVSFSVGPRGLTYNGLHEATTQSPTVIIPKSGSVDLVVESVGIGAQYAQIGIGTVTYWSRGALPGVSVTNPADWLSRYPGLRPGTSPETDAQLRTRNRTKWGTLGTGSPAWAYQHWALSAAPEVKKVNVYTNLDLFDPGRVDVIIAGSSGPVGPSTVLAVQQYIAPTQIGGSRIPETARAVVSSAIGRSVPIAGSLYVQAAYNTTAFQAQIIDNVGQFFASIPIGGLVSRERIVQVLLHPAGLSAGIITDATITSPNVDIQLTFNEVAVPNLTGLTFVSV